MSTTIISDPSKVQTGLSTLLVKAQPLPRAGWFDEAAEHEMPPSADNDWTNLDLDADSEWTWQV